MDVGRITRDRFQRLAFLVSGVVSAILAGYLLVDPEALASVHPLPLVALLVLTSLITDREAGRLLQ